MTAGSGKRHLHYLVLLFSVGFAPAQASTCYGRVAQGSVTGAVALPASGPNFAAYSSLGANLGRTHVHEQVRDIIVDTYAELALSFPGKRYVYGETGLPEGGRMRPHRTHQNGLSVDFMVPVVDAKGKSVPLPSSPLNKFGYGLEFDAQGRSGELRIDYAAIAEHLYQLNKAAQRRKLGIALVIFDPALVPALLKTGRGDALRKLPFMQGTPWIRHDEHYHVDFAVPCQPLPKGAAGKLRAG